MKNLELYANILSPITDILRLLSLCGCKHVYTKVDM